MKKRKIDLKINDIVKIIAGDDKGKTGKVQSINRYTGKLQVEGISIKQRYIKINPNSQKSAKKLENIESFIDISNVQKIQEINNDN